GGGGEERTGDSGAGDQRAPSAARSGGACGLCEAVSAVPGERPAGECGYDCDGGFQVEEVGPPPPVFAQNLQPMRLRGGPNCVAKYKGCPSGSLELLLCFYFSKLGGI